MIELQSRSTLGFAVENLSGFLQIGNTQRRTHETYPKPRKKLDKFIFEKKPR